MTATAGIMSIRQRLQVSRETLAGSYMRILAATGLGITLFSFYHLRFAELGLPLVLMALVCAGVASRIVVRFFRFESCISISDIFVFLTLLLFDGEAAIVVAALEGFFASLRITKKPLTMFFNSGAMAWSTFTTVWVLRFWFGPIAQLNQGGLSSRVVVMTSAMAFVHYAVNSGIVAVAGSLRANQPIWRTYKEKYVWTSI